MSRSGCLPTQLAGALLLLAPCSSCPVVEAQEGRAALLSCYPRALTVSSTGMLQGSCREQTTVSLPDGNMRWIWKNTALVLARAAIPLREMRTCEHALAGARSRVTAGGPRADGRSCTARFSGTRSRAQRAWLSLAARAHVRESCIALVERQPPGCHLELHGILATWPVDSDWLA